MSEMFIQILNQAVFMVICRLGPGYGIYKLTDLGMDVIGHCRSTGHHQHNADVKDYLYQVIIVIIFTKWLP